MIKYIMLASAARADRSRKAEAELYIYGRFTAMDKNSLAKALVELRISTRKACTGENDGRTKGTFSLESKVLFLIRNAPMTPNNLVDVLLMKKSNLTALGKRMESRGLITREKIPEKRQVAYRITEKGLSRLNEKLDEIEAHFRNFLTDEKDYENAEETLSAATRLLSFLGD